MISSYQKMVHKKNPTLSMILWFCCSIKYLMIAAFIQGFSMSALFGHIDECKGGHRGVLVGSSTMRD
jgi:hypothetical protein